MVLIVVDNPSKKKRKDSRHLWSHVQIVRTLSLSSFLIIFEASLCIQFICEVFLAYAMKDSVVL